MTTSNRSMQDFKDFLRTVYKKKKGSGRFVSDDSYCSYLNQFIQLSRISEQKLHVLTKIDFLKVITSFEDLESHQQNFSYYKASADAYYEYIRYTLGYYHSSAA